jgi:hypothetical protein
VHSETPPPSRAKIAKREPPPYTYNAPKNAAEILKLLKTRGTEKPSNPLHAIHLLPKNTHTPKTTPETLPKHNRGGCNPPFIYPEKILKLVALLPPQLR